MLRVIYLLSLSFFLVTSFLVFPREVLAASQIVVATPSVALTIGEPFTLSFSASGLALGASYNAKIRIGSASASMTHGQTLTTLGGTSSWLSDSGDSWSNFPVFQTDSSGVFGGTITGRPNAATWIGLNYLVLRLRKSDQDSYCCDSASVSAMVNAAPERVDTSEAVVTASSPAIDFTTSDLVNLGEGFSAVVSLKNFDADTEIFLKIRAGTDGGQLTKAQTKNGSAYLSDNESWSKFPLIKTDTAGSWSGTADGRIDEEKEEGVYKIRIRLRKKDSETFYDSAFKEMKLAKAPEVMVEKEVAVATPEANLVPEVLGTEAGIMATPATEMVGDSVVTKKASQGRSLIGWGIAGLGVVFLGLAGGFLYNRYRK